MYPNQDTHPNWVYTLICGAYAFSDPIRTIGEQAPQQNYVPNKFLNLFFSTSFVYNMKALSDCTRVLDVGISLAERPLTKFGRCCLSPDPVNSMALLPTTVSIHTALLFSSCCLSFPSVSCPSLQFLSLFLISFGKSTSLSFFVIFRASSSLMGRHIDWLEDAASCLFVVGEII